MEIFSRNPMKSAWAQKPKHYWSFFCPVCRANRKMTQAPSPTLFHYFQIGLTAIVFTLLTWNWFSWKGMVSFFPLWIFFEVVYRSRVRIAVGCPHCGFDPFLYMTHSDWARDEMEVHWRKKFQEKGIVLPPEGNQKGNLTEILRES